MQIRAAAPVALALSALTAVAATQEQVRPQQPTFRAGTEVVRVDVTVLNGRGEPVTSLTPDDFLVFEDGVQQRIQSFKLVERGGSAEPVYDIGTTVDTAAELARDDVGMYLVFWDEYHIPPHVPARRLRDELVKFIRTMVAPADVVAIMDPWTPMSHLRFSRDVNRLLAEAMQLQGRQGVLVPPRNGAEENHLRDPMRARFAREQVALSALKSAMMHLGTLRDGRKTVLYLGREFGVGRDTFTETLDLIRTANDANVAFYSINPDGLTVERSRSGVLADLARNTGGEALLTNTPEVAFRRAVSQASAYYLIGYAPAPAMKYDGKFHEIDVKVKQDGLQVRARSGYWAPSLSSVTAARRKTAEAPTLPAEITAALSQLARLDWQEKDDVVRARTILVPAEPSPTLHLPAPELWRTRSPAELRAATSEAPPPSSDERSFARTDRLIVRLAPSGSAAEGAKLTVSLVNRQGRRLTDLPIVREGSGWVLDLPLTSIARGGYLLVFEAVAGEDRAAAYVPIRVE